MGDEVKAQWSAAYINDLPDSAFLYIEPGGEKDETGRTTPRSLRHLPYRNADGEIDLPHLRNAITRLSQADTGESGGERWLSDELRQRLLAKARRLLEEAQNKSLAAKVLRTTDDALVVGGWGVVFGGQDLDGDEFTSETDFWLDRLPGPKPVLFEHSFDPVLGLKVLGQAVVEAKDDGLWVEAQLERHNKYVEQIRRLVEAGVLGWSSGAVAHLVRRDGNIIKCWPIVEFSLTPVPAEPRTLGVQELKSLTDCVPIKSLLPEDSGELSAGGKATGTVEGLLQNTEEVTNVNEINLDELATKVAERLAQEPASKAAGFAVPPATEPGKPDAVKAFDLWLHYGDRASVAIKAAMQEGTDSEGGYLTPVEYSNQLVTSLAEASIIRQAGARVIPMRSDQMKVPSLTYATAAVLTAEEAAYNEQEPTVGEVTFTAYKYTRLAKVSDELVADSQFPLWNAVLLPDFTQAFAAAENAAFTTGTGTGQPQGVVTGAGVGVTAASASVITADEVIDLYHSLNHLYRERAVWMMHDSTIKVIRKLKDSDGQYLWQPGLQSGQPDRLLGRPVITNNSMATIAASAKVILFGDFSYYWIGEREGLTIKRLDELYAANGQVGFRAYKRFDGRVMLASAFKVLQMAAA